MLHTHNLYRISPEDGRMIQNDDLDDVAVKQLLDAGILVESEMPVSCQKSCSNKQIPFRSAWLELTSACNLYCSHCYMGANRIGSESIIDWESVIRYLANNGCHQVIFIGGEPLCNPCFLHYAEFAKKMSPSMRLCVATNGTLWTKKLLARMKELDVFLKFSLLGSTAEKHDAVTRVQGSFNALVKNIDRAIDLGIHIEISTTLVPSSSETENGIAHFVASRFGDIKHSVARVRPQGRQLSCGHTSRVCEPEKLAVHISKEFFAVAEKWHPCLHGKVAFSYSGFVYPCIMARYEKKPIDEVLKQLPVMAFKNWWTLTKDEINGCQKCALRYACFDCRGFSTSMNEAPCNCRLARELALQDNSYDV